MTNRFRTILLNRIRLNYVFIFALSVLQLLLVAACGDEYYPVKTESEGEHAELVFTKAIATDPVRVIILGAKTGNPPNRFYSNKLYETLLTNGRFSVETFSGLKDLYFFANEPEGYTFLSGDTAKDNQIFRNAIENAIIQYDPDSEIKDENKIPMSFLQSDYYVSPSVSPTTENIELTRRMSKITIKFSYKSGASDLSTVRLVFKKIGIVDLPKHYYWTDQPYPVNAGFINTRLSDADIEYTATDGSEQRGSNTFYLPSYKVSGDNKAKIHIVVERFNKITGTSEGEKSYYVPIGDALNTTETGSTAYDLTANRHYDVTLEIDGDQSLVFANIKDWIKEDINGDISNIHISAPSLIVMSYPWLGNAYQVNVGFSGSDITDVYVNASLVGNNRKLTDYLPIGVHMPWLTESRVAYSGNGGILTLAYDPAIGGIDESNYKLEVEFQCRLLRKRLTIISENYAGLITGSINDWISTETDGGMDKNGYISVREEINVSEMPFDETTGARVYLANIPIRASSAIELSVDGKTLATSGELQGELNRDWIESAVISMNSTLTEGTLNLRLRNIATSDSKSCKIGLRSGKLSTQMNINYDLNP